MGCFSKKPMIFGNVWKKEQKSCAIESGQKQENGNYCAHHLPERRGKGLLFLVQNDEKFNKSNFLFIFSCIPAQFRYNNQSLVKII